MSNFARNMNFLKFLFFVLLTLFLLGAFRAHASPYDRGNFYTFHHGQFWYAPCPNWIVLCWPPRQPVVRGGQLILPPPPSGPVYVPPDSPLPPTPAVAPAVVVAPPPPPVVAVPTFHMLSHNGSLMRITEVAPGVVEIRYEQPRPSLWHLGVQPGTLLLTGTWRDGRLVATAYVFAVCGPLPYQVVGTVDPRGVLTLTGPAPVPIGPPWAPCANVGLFWNGNSSLAFFPA